MINFPVNKLYILGCLQEKSQEQNERWKSEKRPTQICSNLFFNDLTFVIYSDMQLSFHFF